MNTNVLLVNIDSRIPNLALKKVEKYYLDNGHKVIWDMPLAAEWADVIYVSCVFTWNREKCKEWELYPHAWIGGSGYSLDIELDGEIESVRPRINLGFATRGCIRKCPFCIVPEKEGKIRIVDDLLGLWDGKARLVTILDNNILALPGHFTAICRQAQEHKLQLDFNQGLDHRLLTGDIAAEMKKTRHKNEWRFSFDHPDLIDSVRSSIGILKKHGINRAFWYVLVGYNTNLDEDLFRIEYLKSEGQTVFVQRFNKDDETLQLARWANQHHIFRKMTYWEFLDVCSGGRR